MSYVREGRGKNQFLFNGIERIEDFELSLDFTLYRTYDPQLNRWLQIDPKTSERESGYVGIGNNPILYLDPEGDTIRVKGSEEFIAQYEVDRAIIEQTEEGAAMFKFLDEVEQDITISEAFSMLGWIQNLFVEGSGDENYVAASETKGNGVDAVNGENGVSVKVSQINGVEVDGVITNSTEILVHELQHAKDIVDNTLVEKRKELGKTDPNGSKLRDFAESRAMMMGNVIRKSNGKSKLRRTYNGKELLNNEGKPKKKY